MKGGDIVLCNHSSYIDQIYLTYLFGNPIFTSIPNLEEPVSSFFFFGGHPFTEKKYYKDHLRRETLWSSVYNTVSAKASSKSGVKLSDLASQAKKENRVLVIFPEACTSNGEAMLDCAHIFSGSGTLEGKIHAITLSYPFQDFSPTFTVQSIFFHFAMLCSQLKNDLHVSFVQNLAAFPSEKEERESWEEDVYEAMSKCANVKRVSLGAKQRKEFDEYWYKTKRGHYVKKD